jgi:hypothetical protein
MVVGARRGPGISKYPWKRLARWILRRLVWSLTGTMVPDLNSGMRIFRSHIYREFNNLLPTGFSFTSTITVASLYSGYKLKYIDINYDKRVGESNIKPVRDFFGFTILILRIATYFEPLKFFVPLSMFLFIAAILRGIRDVVVTEGHGIGSLAVILMFFGFQMLVTGILADVIVRRTKVSAPLEQKHFQISKQ